MQSSNSSTIAKLYSTLNNFGLSLPFPQIAQFFFNVFYNLNALFRLGEACKFPLWMMKLSSWYNASFIILFSNFYLKSYSKETKKLKNA